MRRAVAYLDASALVKLIRVESESAALEAALAEHPGQASSAIARTEVMRATRRHSPATERLAGIILGRTTLLAVSEQILAAASRVEPAALRTLDAIHVATAQTLGDDLTVFLAYDRRLCDAARANGLPVASPGA